MEVDGERQGEMRGVEELGRENWAGKLAQKVRGGQPISGVERHPKIGARWTLNRV